MRLIATILLLFYCTACQHSHRTSGSPPSQATRHPRASGSIWQFESQFAGITYKFEIPDDILGTASKWKAETDPLPLTPKHAEQAAINEAARLRPEVGNWYADEISLRSIADDCWIYEVVLQRADVTLGGSPLPEWFLRIPVLMSGAAVHPLPAR
jgi:hypothetical protein